MAGRLTSPSLWPSTPRLGNSNRQMATDARRYRFSPLDRRGLFIGLNGGQLAVVAAGCAVALGVLRVVPTLTGLFLSGSVVALAAAAACWSVAGRPPSGWV